VLLSFTRVPKAVPHAPQASGFGRLLARLADFLAPRPKAVIAVSMVLTVATLAAVLQIRVENDLARKLPVEHPLRRANAVVEKALGGSGQVEVIVDLGAPDAIKAGDNLARMWNLQQAILAQPEAVMARSVGNIFGQIHGIIAPEQARQHAMPSGKTIAEYLLLFGSAGGALDTLLDPSHQYARILVRSPNLSAEKAVELAGVVETLGSEHLPDASVQVTGIAMLAARWCSSRS
jgi:predicted RND superfamily exporter protein